MRPLLFLLMILLAPPVSAQLLFEFDKPPSQLELSSSIFDSKQSRYRFLSIESLNFSPDSDRAVSLIDTRLNSTVIAYYLRPDSPFFILEQIGSFDRPHYESALWENGFRQASADEWILPGIGGATFSECDSERKIVEPNYTLLSESRAFVFFWFEPTGGLLLDQ